MIRLDTTSTSLEVVLAGAITTTQPQVTACYSTKTSTTYAGGKATIATSSATPVTIVSAPSASTTIDVDYISIYNRDTASITFTVQYNVSSTRTIITKMTLATLETAVYVHGHGWQALDANGNTKTTNSGAGYVVGPASSTDKAIARFNGTTGVLLQNSSATIDNNGNIFANNHLDNSTIVTAAAGTTILTVASARNQVLTGSTTQTYQLPDATTLSLGPWFTFNNNSSGALTINNAGGSSQYVVPAGGFVTALLTNISTANGVWDFHPAPPATVTWGSGTTGLVMNSALSTTAVINAGASSSTVPVFIPQRGSGTTGYGGDSTHLYGVIGGTTSYTYTTTLLTLPGTISSGANSGTGGAIKLFGSTSGDATVQVAAAAGTATVFQLPTTNGTANYALTTNGSGITSWNQISLTAGVAGILPMANGGTNANLTASNGGIFYSTASAGAVLSGTATANQMLQSGSNSAPAWSTTTWPSTLTANRILYASASNTVGSSSLLNFDGATFILGSNTASIASYQPSQSLFWQQADSQQELRVNSFTSSASNSTNLVLFKGRGTAASPADIQNGDTVGSIIPCAVSGSTYYHVGSINAVVNGTFTSGQNPPSRFDFYVGPANTAPTLQTTIADKGIGVGTTNPNPNSYGACVTIASTSNFTGIVMQYGGADGDGNFCGEFAYNATANTGAPDFRVAAILGVTQGSTANWRGGRLVFRTRGDGGAFFTALTINNDQSAVLGTDPTGSGLLRVAGGITISSSSLIQTKSSFSNGAGVSSGTLTNAPAAGNPSKWIPIDDNGTTRYIPAW